MNLWDDNSVQFPRLLAEIAANVELTNEQLKALCDSMDLTPGDISELFERAEAAWEQAKERQRKPTTSKSS